MKKYTDTEKLKAEIEKKRQEFINKGEQKDLHDAEIIRRAVISSCNDFLILIDSLQQEESPEVDLEEEIKDWCDKEVTGVKPIYTGDSLTYSILPRTARHFYELGLNERK